MARPVECLLVGTEGPASDDAINHMTTLVRSRFNISPAVLQGRDSTKDGVLKALDEIARRNQRRGMLFIVLFSGHGGIRNKVHSWRLTDLPIDDETIIDKFADFHRDSEIFLVSDCCYGGQMLHKRGPGEDDEPVEPTPELMNLWRENVHSRLRGFARRAAFQLRENGIGSHDKSRMPEGHVVLAASSDWLLIRGRPSQNDFVRTLCEVIPRAPTYAALQPTMTDYCTPIGQCNWLVDAMPEEALQLPPLAP